MQIEHRCTLWFLCEHLCIIGLSKYSGMTITDLAKIFGSLVMRNEPPANASNQEKIKLDDKKIEILRYILINQAELSNGISYNTLKMNSVK